MYSTLEQQPWKMDVFSVCEMQYNMKCSMWIGKCHQNSATRKKQQKFHFWVNYSFTVESIGHMAATPTLRRLGSPLRPQARDGVPAPNPCAIRDRQVHKNIYGERSERIRKCEA